MTMLTVLQQRITKKISTLLTHVNQSSAPTVYYFGYGANIDPDFFKKRGIKFKIIGMATLKDYSFEFNTPCEYASKGFGGVVPKQGSVVFGTLYEISSIYLRLLDCLEWVDFNFYRRDTLSTECNGQTYNTEIYIPKYPRINLRPSTGYKNLVIQGAIKMNCPSEYVKYLQSFESQESFDLDHSFNLRNPSQKRLLPAHYYKLHDKMREILCRYI